MAVVDDINENSSSSEFLTEKETSAIVEKITSGSLSKVADEFQQKIKDELGKGLSPKALSLEGRAPLNDLALEQIDRLNVTIDSINVLKSVAKSGGNEHTNEEANKFLNVTFKEYEDLCTKVDKAKSEYDAAEYTHEVTGEDGKKHNEPVRCGDKNSIEINWKPTNKGTPEATKITMKGDKASDSHFSDEYNKLETAFKAAEKYYPKVQEAIDFYTHNGGGKLETDDTSKMSLPVSNDTKLPKGVRPDATKRTIKTDNEGGHIDIYTNTDGSQVEIAYAHGNRIKRHVVRNRYGYNTETYQYDESGKLTGKNVWTYERADREDGNKNVYESKYTHYKYNSETKEWEQDGEENKHYGYSYPDKNGNIKNIKGNDQPESSDIGTPKSGGSNTTPDSEKSGKKTTGTPAIITHDNAKELVGAKKPFILPKGSILTDDRPAFTGNGNTTYMADEDLYFEYDEEYDVYFAKNSNGEYVSAFGYTSDLDGKPYTRDDLINNRDYMDPDNFVHGYGDHDFWYGWANNGSRVDD